MGPMFVAGRRTKVRWMVAFLMWLAVSINYLDRTNLSVAVPVITKQFHISTAEMGIILSSFFWSYTLFQIPSGWFADKVGHRISLAFSVVWWSVMTAAMAATRSVGSIIGVRLLLGVGEAGAYPSNSGIAAKWFPDKERARIGAMFDSGSKVGSAIAAPLVAWLLTLFGWQVPFIVSGLLGIGWAVIWLLYYRDPEKHRYINQEELQYIRDGQVKKEGLSEAQPVKWYQLLRYRNILAMTFGYFCLLYAFYFYVSWMPTYLVKQRHMTLLTMGFVAMLPPLTGLVFELIGGWLSDHLVIRGVKVTTARKINLVGGMLLATSIAFAGLTSSAVLSVVLLSLSYGGTQFAAAAAWALPGDVAPVNTTSTVGGIQNFFGNVAGILGPIVTGFIVSATGSFAWALGVSGIITLIGACTYLFALGKIEPITVKSSSLKAATATAAQ